MASAISLGAAVMNSVQNLGQIAEIGQNHAHQREQIMWQRRNYTLDAQSVRLDALDHAKEEIKSHYDTYVGRIDTLLLVLALIFPFALNVIQFSDPFVPATAADCPDCIEAEHTWLVIVWACLIGIVLVLPFWGILMLIRCKLQLDRWLEYSLAGLHTKRRDIVSSSKPSQLQGDDRRLERDEETEQIVYQLVNMVLRYQEFMARTWNAELGRLVHASTVLLWLSASSALMLTSLSMWIYLVNKGDEHTTAGYYFAGIVVAGGVGPALYLIWQAFREEVKPPVSGLVEENIVREDSFPLAKRASVVFRGDWDRPTSPLRSRQPSTAALAAGFRRGKRGFGWCARRWSPVVSGPLTESNGGASPPTTRSEPLLPKPS